MADQVARVRILPDALINKIAAGEVVERPASVIKELVENAVDAGARSVRVEIRGGGRTFIAVRDDGRGMGRDDVLLAIERHATSKIRQPDDLFDIHTLGFRGEALPSIAQVSKMEIRTAEHGVDNGTVLVLDGGVLKAVREAPPAPGTEVIVRRLFFNTPVRLRFLKTDRTELGHAAEAVVRVALAHPGVRFDLVRAHQAGASAVLQAPATDDLRRRVGDLLGASIRQHLVDVRVDGDDMRLHGLAGRPALHRSSRKGLYLFVNGRPVRDRLLLGAVGEAYRGLVPKGRFPIVVLFLELPPAEVDHNVHPTKSEVRFVRGNLVYRFVADAIGQALRPGSAPTRPPPAEPPGPCNEPSPQPPPGRRGTPSWGAVRETLFDDVGYGAGLPAPPVPAPVDPQVSLAAPIVGPFASMRPLGQFEGTYLLLQDGDQLVVLDQHAAHERINYERILASERGPASQRLLVPEVLDLPRAQAEVLVARNELLETVGIGVDDFGGGSVAVTSAPPWVPAAEVRTLLQDVAQEMMGLRPSTAIDELRHRVAAVTACHGSVRAHQRLGGDEVLALLRGLDAAEHPYSCPHGRPILVRFSLREVEKWFDRT
jgi:DNA mismatch repair protein MutL